MHLRAGENRCGQPHCLVCRNAQRRTPSRGIPGLAIYLAVGGILLVIPLVLVWARG